MFIGHFALGFAAKRVAPTVSLGTAFLACQFADLLWPALVLLGVERVSVAPGDTVLTPLRFEHYPYSHSLLALAGWALLLGLSYHLLRRSRARPAIVVTALVLSHWILDALTHRPDLPLTLRGPERIGLGLWNAVVPAVALELLLFAVGVVLYARATRAIDRTGRFALWGLVAFLLLVHVANLAGPPPPSPQAVAWIAQALWLVVAWGYWIDRHRRTAT